MLQASYRRPNSPMSESRLTANETQRRGPRVGHVIVSARLSDVSSLTSSDVIMRSTPGADGDLDDGQEEPGIRGTQY